MGTTATLDIVVGNTPTTFERAGRYPMAQQGTVRKLAADLAGRFKVVEVWDHNCKLVLHYVDGVKQPPRR